MQKRKNFLPVFFTFFIITVLIFIFSSLGFLNGLTGVLEQGSIPLQRAVFGMVRSVGIDTSEVSRLRAENVKLAGELAKAKKQEKEMQALSDQFHNAKIPTQKLLPATVMGMSADRMTLDKGESDGIRKGDIIIFEENFVGKVERVSQHISIVDLVTNKNISLTAKKMNSDGPIGVVKGTTDGTVLENVTQSEKLNKGDLILTKGDISDRRETGFPPDLIIGKVATVNKKASSLFQNAEVRSLVDFSTLTTVFVLVR